MSLSSEYSSIVDERCAGKQLFCDHDAYKIAIGIAEDCQKLAKEKHAALEKRIAELLDEVAAHERKASKPVRQLTDEECDKIWNECPLLARSSDALRWLAGKYRAKQNEPNEIPFDQSKLNEGGWNVKVYSEQGIKDCFYSAHRVVLVRK